MIDIPELTLQFVVIEMRGGTRLAGRLYRNELCSLTFLRLDVPEVDGKAGFTRFLAPDTVASITLVTEEMALATLRMLRPQAVWGLTPKKEG